MASIHKLSIQGIRSFGSNTEDVGMISFYKPLTCILGPNGTGKTTIIECLKYITTGELPPGGKNGAAFINDPKVSKMTEVKAQVRLLFTDIKGELCSVQRSLIATQKKNKVEMKTLEGLITRELVNGEKIHIGSKCAEMDREMISMLGVSKAILENVIFCHQEESNWPLSEGKALKQKFDDIFASTRYVKALEVIKKCRQDKMSLIKEYQIEIKYLKQNKDKVIQISTQLEEIKEKKQVSMDIIAKVEIKLNPIMEKLSFLEEKEEDIRKITNDIAKLEGEKGQIKRAIQDLIKNIKTVYQGNMNDLKDELLDFSNKIKEKELTLKQNKEKEISIEREIHGLSKEKSQLLTETAKLQQDKDRNSLNLQKRNEKIDVLASSYVLNANYSLNEDDTLLIMSQLDDKLKEFLNDTKVKKEEMKNKLIELQRCLDAKRNIKTKFETEFQIKQDNMNKNNIEVNRISMELNRVESSAGQLNIINVEIDLLEKKLKDIESNIDITAMKTSIQQMQSNRNSLEAKIRQLDGQLTKITAESSIRSQLEIFTKDKSTKEENVRRLLGKNEDTLKHILGSVPTGSFNKKIDEYLRDHSKVFRNNSDKLQQFKSSLTKLETTRKIEQENLLKKQGELRGYEQKIRNITQDKDFNEGLNALVTKLQSSQDNKGHLMAVDYMFKKYIEKLKRHNPDCPLCHRPFEEQVEVEELISEMDTKLNLIPEKLERLQSTITEVNSDYEAWLQLNPIIESMVACREVDIPKIEESLKLYNSQLSTLLSEIADKEEEVELYNNDESVAKSLLPDASQIDRMQLEINELKRKIQIHSSKITSENSKSISEIQSEKAELIANMDQASKNLEFDRHKLSEVTEGLEKSRFQLHNLKSSKLKIETDLQQRMQLESTKKDLQFNNEKLMIDVKEAQDRLTPLKNEIEELLRSKNNLTTQQDKDYEKSIAKCNQLKEDIKQLNFYQLEIDEYARENIGDKLLTCQDNFASLEENRKDLESRKSKLSLILDQIQKDIIQQEIRQRELEDNLQVMKKEEEIKNLDNRIKEEDSKLGNVDRQNIVRDKITLKEQAVKFQREKDILKSKQLKLEGEFETINRDLNSKEYEKAEDKYREKIIQLKTTQIACADIEKYYKALDRTIMSYHNQKMSEINKIIKELWMNTYRGNDIDTIEIRSDEDDDGAVLKARRTYNYRVVMLKGQAELDMRGRCSAGQKVLASIIIRLALAETFCLNFGVLALDEPTTNLDQKNIHSLAEALVNIIKCRQRQKNFQLILITHDENFIDLLGRSDFIEDYFRIEKHQRSGFSRIIKSKFALLNS